MSSSVDPTTPTDFIETAFETDVTDDDIELLVSKLDAAIETLRSKFESDSLLESVIRGESGTQGIKSSYSSINQDPEPLTQEALIEPLLGALGYEEWSQEVSGASDQRERVADYGIPLTDHTDIDSRNLLRSSRRVITRVQTRQMSCREYEF